MSTKNDIPVLKRYITDASSQIDDSISGTGSKEELSF